MLTKYHIKYYSSRTHRTDNATLIHDGRPADVVNEFFDTHPEAIRVYQVFKKLGRSARTSHGIYRVNAGNTARVIEADSAQEAASVVESQTGLPATATWKLVMAHRPHRGRDMLVEA